MAKYIEQRSLSQMVSLLLDETGSKQTAADVFGTTAITSLYGFVPTGSGIRLSELKTIYDGIEEAVEILDEKGLKDLQIDHTYLIAELYEQDWDAYESPLLRRIIKSVKKNERLGTVEHILSNRSMKLINEVRPLAYSSTNALSDFHTIDMYLCGESR